MADLFIFVAGLVVTLMVAGAVTLLLWGAANEPRHREPLEPSQRAAAPRPRALPLVRGGRRTGRPDPRARVVAGPPRSAARRF